MREKDMEKLLHSLPDSASEKKLRESMGDLKRFAASEEGKRLVNGLGKAGGQAAMRAADGLKNGDPQAVKTLVSYLQSTEDGKLLTQKILDTLNRGGQ